MVNKLEAESDEIEVVSLFTLQSGSMANPRCLQRVTFTIAAIAFLAIDGGGDAMR